MTANELRRGNYINYVTKDVVKVCIVDFSLINELDTASNSGSYRLYNGIPLTEDILLKCEFVFDSNYLCYRLGDFMIHTDFDNSPKFSFYVESLDRDIKLLYVHQLQNLYFALTETELTINL